MKDQIRNRINPAELGVGLLIGKTTKNGDLILTCKNEEKDMREIQHKIQEDKDKITKFRKNVCIGTELK
jgi:hypothetical protein